jgi:hypothetical protein
MFKTDKLQMKLLSRISKDAEKLFLRINGFVDFVQLSTCHHSPDWKKETDIVSETKWFLVI